MRTLTLEDKEEWKVALEKATTLEPLSDSSETGVYGSGTATANR